MTSSSKKPILDGDKVFKATNLKIKTIHLIFLGLAVARSGKGNYPALRGVGNRICPVSPLGVGFFTGAIDAKTRFAEGDFRKAETRLAPENLPHNLVLVDLLNRWAKLKHATPAQIALAWLMAQKPWIVPIPGTTQMAHMLENIGANAVQFTSAEFTELNRSVAAIQIQGARLPDFVQVFSDVEAPPKS